MLGFGGVLFATLGNYGSGSAKGILYMLLASAIFSLAGPWNKAAAKKTDSFTVSVLNLGCGGFALAVIGFAIGGSLHPQQGWAIPVLLVLAFISGAGYVLWALLMKNNPHFPHRHLRAYYPNHERAALGPAQRRAAV